jgi:two-component system CheB/CheR fusion protein
MKKPLQPEAPSLRKQAEDRLLDRDAAELGSRGHVDALQLLHELEVHEIELEMQNEELRTARLELEHGLARYTELFDFAPIGYATLGPFQIIRELNHSGARLLGKERGRLIGRPFGTLVTPGDRPRFSELLERAMAADTKQVGEIALRWADEPSVYVRVTAVALPRGEPTIMLAFEDITERKAHEDQLARVDSALRDADRHKDEFLAVLSHELRNPLAPIRQGIFMLSQTELKSEAARKIHGVIDRQVTLLTRLVDDLLDMTRIRRGKIQLQVEQLELSQLVEHTVDDHRSRFEARGIALESRIESQPTWVSGDSARLIQVISNLLANAEKFTPRGGTVTVSLGVVGSNATLRVHDTGVGIAPQLIQDLFAPFAQAPQTMDRARGGLGLGLHMVRGLVELHGGSVVIHSKGPGHGAEVTVTLPLRLTQSPAPKPLLKKPVLARSLRVFVIEDNTDAADTLGDALTFIGHEVQVAYDGASALERAKSFCPDVVICDIGLPGMDGYAVARALRADPPLRNAYLVALSGYARPEDLERAVDAGFDQHVAKPANLEKLNQLLQEAARAPSAASPETRAT